MRLQVGAKFAQLFIVKEVAISVLLDKKVERIDTIKY